MRHPGEIELALYSGGDLGILERWRIRRHAARCDSCRRGLEAFAAARAGLREAAGELPEGVRWPALAAEMQANIRLGLAAGECVESGQELPERLGWRAAVVLASLTAVVVTGWWLNVPRPGVPAANSLVAGRGIVLEATQGGIELKEDGRVLTLLHPAAETVTYSVDAQGALRARYVDSETGQVTINHVYVQ